MVNAKCALPSMREEPVKQIQFSSDSYFFRFRYCQDITKVRSSNMDVVLVVFIFKSLRLALLKN